MKEHLKKLLIIGLFFTSIGGVMLHTRIHSASNFSYGYIPLISGLISAFAIPILFLFRRTLHLGFILNGFSVIIGTVTMAHFSLVKSQILADIFMLWGKFFIGYVIFRLELHNVEAPEVKLTGLRHFRYPNLGFWFVHLVTLSLVYYLGNVLWR